jgi:DNA (cytosine-5)-methyltransferase 3A
MEDGKWVKRYESNCEPKANAITTVQTDSMIAEPVRVGHINSGGQGDRIYSIDGKSCSVTAPGGGAGGSGGGLYAEPIRVGDIGSTAQAHRVYSCDGKSVTINAGGGGQGGKTGLYLCPVTNPGKNLPIYEVCNGKITTKGKQYPIKLADGYYIIRKLTVRECMRLQTVPEWYDFSVISNSQAYKCLGNGWTCDVITHLIKATQTAARRKWLDDLLGDCL